MSSEKNPSDHEAAQLSVSRWRSYAVLLRQNPRFRRFWLASVISQLGNWFNYIAIFVLLNQLTGSGETVSWFLIAKFLPTAVFGPTAGVIADRFSRKTIMIACDAARVFVVLGFLTVDSADEVWIIYLLALLQETLWSFFDPAKQATVPNLCRPSELNVANALSGASWSILLAFGAALGGFATALFGWKTAIVIDAFSFALSAFMISRIDLPRNERGHAMKKEGKASREMGWRDVTGINDLWEGWRYVRGHAEVWGLLLVKSGWALSGGILVILTVFGEQVLALPSGGGSGVLYSCRGLGAAVGPVLAWRLLGESMRAMHRGIGISFFISAAAYLLFSQAPSLLAAAPFVVLGHIGGSIQWVFSTTLLQRMVPDQYRGRVFSAEMALLTLVLSVSTYLTGVALDGGISPRHTAAWLALIFLVPGVLWNVYLLRSASCGKMDPQGPD